MTAPQHWTGGPTPPVRVATPEKLAMMVELLPSVASLRDLGAMLGWRLDAVRREAEPFLAIMKLNGTHPKCGCGRDRFHPYGCVDSYAKGKRDGIVPGRTLEESKALVARREGILAAIVAGTRYCDIEQQFGLYPKTARKYLRHLSAEQFEARRAIDAKREADRRRRPFDMPMRLAA